MSTTRNKLKLPKPTGINALERDATSIYLRWTILSSADLSKKQLKNLQFEFKTTDNKLSADCIDNAPSHEYKARLCGLRENTKYRFQIRSKLKLDSGVSTTSPWSDYIEISTRRKKDNFMIISDEKQLERQSVIHRLKLYMNENKKLQLRIDQLQIKLKNQSPKDVMPTHWNWDYKKIVNWIMRIEDGAYKQYKKTLTKALKEEGITGKDLVMVTESNLKEWGITNFNARKVLLQFIQKLTANDAKPSIIYDATLTEQLSDPYSPHSPNAPVFVKQQKTEMIHSNAIQNEIKEPDLPQRTADISQSVQALLEAHSFNENKKNKVWRYGEGMLSVLVVCASNVDNMDMRWDNWNKKTQIASDPYVELELKGNYKKEKTKSIENCSNPKWNEKFQLFVDDAKHDVLKCRLYDYDKWTMDDKIGDVEIPIMDVLNANGYVRKEFDVVGSKTGCKLELELKYWETLR